MNNLIEYIGLLAGFCTTAAFLPQLFKVLKTRETRGISCSMYVIFLFGLVTLVHLWLAPQILADYSSQ